MNSTLLLWNLRSTCFRSCLMILNRPTSKQDVLILKDIFVNCGLFLTKLWEIDPHWNQHWHHSMVDAAKFGIPCKGLKLLRKAGHLKLIQNSEPSTIMWHQCDIRMESVELRMLLQISRISISSLCCAAELLVAS